MSVSELPTQIDENAIQGLRDALEEAERGVIIGFVLVGTMPGGTCRTTVGGRINRVSTVAYAEKIKAEAISRWMEDDEDE